MAKKGVPRCQSWRARNGMIVQCEKPAWHYEDVHVGDARGERIDWHDAHPNVLNGVCTLCGSGVLTKTGEHIRDDLEPCFGGKK